MPQVVMVVQTMYLMMIAKSEHTATGQACNLLHVQTVIGTSFNGEV